MPSFNKKDVIKHSAAIQTSNNVSLLQRRTYNVLLANAFEKLLDRESHQIKLQELFKTLEYNSNNVAYIKDLLRQLVSIQVEWNILGKDGSDIWGVTSLLSEVEISDGVLTYSFAPGLRKKLFNPSMYARLSLSLQNKFSSKYALCLYELFTDYFDVSRNYGETPWIPLSELRKLLGLKDSEYKRYSDFNHHIIKKSLNEINALTDLDVSPPTPKKFKRSVTELKFTIRKKTQKIKDLIEDTPDILDKGSLLYILINEFRIDIETAQGLINKYSEDQIRSNLEYVKKANIKKSLPGYTIRAIENNWTIDAAQAPQAPKNIDSIPNETPLDAVVKMVKEQRKSRLREIFDNLDQMDQDLLRSEFSDKILKGDYNQFLTKIFKQNGFEGTGIKIQFDIFLSERLLDPLEHDIDIYLKKENIQIEEA